MVSGTLLKFLTDDKRLPFGNPPPWTFYVASLTGVILVFTFFLIAYLCIFLIYGCRGKCSTPADQLLGTEDDTESMD